MTTELASAAPPALRCFRVLSASSFALNPSLRCLGSLSVLSRYSFSPIASELVKLLLSLPPRLKFPRLKGHYQRNPEWLFLSDWKMKLLQVEGALVSRFHHLHRKDPHLPFDHQKWQKQHLQFSHHPLYAQPLPQLCFCLCPSASFEASSFA